MCKCRHLYGGISDSIRSDAFRTFCCPPSTVWRFFFLRKLHLGWAFVDLLKVGGFLASTHRDLSILRSLCLDSLKIRAGVRIFARASQRLAERQLRHLCSEKRKKLHLEKMRERVATNVLVSPNHARALRLKVTAADFELRLDPP